MINASQLSTWKLLGRGGEGAVYAMPDGRCAKIYHRGVLTRDTQAKLWEMFTAPLARDWLCWPGEPVESNGQLVGFAMKRASGHELARSIFIKPLFLQRCPGWTRRNLVAVASAIVEQFEVLHAQDVLMGDVNPNNILISSAGVVYFVDCDSYQVRRHSCPVGHPLFTPPELQGHTLRDVLRTVDNEIFSIAILLFMILVPGKHPFAHLGGTDPAANIKQGLFAYQYGEEFNYETPQGPWESIWINLPIELREAFHDTFCKLRRPGLSEWREILGQYRVALERNELSDELYPLDRHRARDNVSLYIDRRRVGSGTGVNHNPNGSDQVGAVLELSTKAVKMLSGNRVGLANGFNWDAFQNLSHLVHVGRIMNQNNEIMVSEYEARVIPSIRLIYDRVRNDARARDIMVVATAAYRGAANREEVLELIKRRTGLEVRVLTKDEEAQATLRAFLWAKPSAAVDGRSYILIDQGGGSTEVTCFDEHGATKWSVSLSLGTEVAENAMFVNSAPSARLATALHDADTWIQKHAYDRLYRADVIGKGEDSCVIGVGTAITKGTNYNSNKQQHGQVMDLERIDFVMSSKEQWLAERFPTVQALEEALRANVGMKAGDMVSRAVTIRLGLSMYRYLMTKLGANEALVSGVGLRYGIFHELMEPRAGSPNG